MAERIDITDFLTKVGDMPILDVRSPKEFNSGHIPSSKSIPIFDDDERAIVGTLYKKEGRRMAIKRGLDIIGPKMKAFIEHAESLKSENFAIYCWRGGMRSDSFAWLLGQYGYEIFVLEGGYKSFRRAMSSLFQRKLPLHIISGYTGSKKTELLQRIRHYGGQVVDLEGLAQHQGSSFGNQKCTKQPSTEHFQNLLFTEFKKLDFKRPIYIEDECQRIGQVSLPDELFAQMRKSTHILINVAKEERVQFLLEDYGKLEGSQLISATQAISRKLGHANSQKAINSIKEGDLRSAVDTILIYYDKRYKASREKKKEFFKLKFDMKMNEIDRLAQELVKNDL